MAFQKSEAELNGFDEALVLTADGHASEASRREPVRRPRRRPAHAAGQRRHPRGRDAHAPILELAEVLRHPDRGAARSTDRRSTSPTRCSSCGTGVQLSPVIELDHRPIAGGAIGPITKQLHEAYFAAVRGNDSRFAHWLTPI